MTREDPAATAQSTTGEFLNLVSNAENFRLEYDKLFTYPDGRQKLEGARVAVRGVRRDGDAGRHARLTQQAARQQPGQSGLLALDWWNGNRSVLVDVDLTGLLIGATPGAIGLTRETMRTMGSVTADTNRLRGIGQVGRRTARRVSGFTMHGTGPTFGQRSFLNSLNEASDNPRPSEAPTLASHSSRPSGLGLTSFRSKPMIFQSLICVKLILDNEMITL